MYYIAQTTKTVEQAAADLTAAVQRHGYGVLHVHDLGATLRNKGVDFAPECRVFEVCNPGHAARVLAQDLRINMALPCRISVFSQDGVTQIGLIRPGPMLAGLSDDPALRAVADAVEAETIAIIDDAV